MHTTLKNFSIGAVALVLILFLSGCSLLPGSEDEAATETDTMEDSEMSGQDTMDSEMADDMEMEDDSSEDSEQDSDEDATGMKFMIDQDQSEASYTVKKEFLGADVLDVTGTTGSVTGSINIDEEADTVSGTVTVNLLGLDSGDSGRDNHVKDQTLNLNELPNATFEITSISVDDIDLSSTESQSFDMTGNLTIASLVQEVTFDTVVTVDGDKIVGSANGEISLDAFGIEAPSAAGVYSVNDVVQLSIELVANKNIDD